MSVRFRICKGVSIGSSGIRVGGRPFGRKGPYVNVGRSGVLGSWGGVRVWQGASYGSGSGPAKKVKPPLKPNADVLFEVRKPPYHGFVEVDSSIKKEPPAFDIYVDKRRSEESAAGAYVLWFVLLLIIVNVLGEMLGN